MDNINLRDWDEARYLELNTYFRVRIQGMIDADPYIKELLQKDQSLQLQDLIERMTNHDQELWQEFLKLDRIKLDHDMKNHLEGRGTPYHPNRGFSSGPEGEEKPW